jgi:hypothetical protein
MQATYFRYYITRDDDTTPFSFDIRPFLMNFCSWQSPKLKSQFEYNGEKLYLIHSGGDHYLFLHTLDNEIIKKINSDDITIDDLKIYLRDDSIGFASYLLVKEDHFGISCKMLSPRGTVFAVFVNELFKKLQLPYIFNIIPITHTVMRTEIPTLKRVGAIYLKLERGNHLYEQLVEAMSGDLRQRYHNIGAIEITVHPEERKGDIRDVLQDISSKAGETGVSSFEARAVTAFSDKVMDVYLVGQGAVRHDIRGETDDGIQINFDGQYFANKLLHSRLREMRESHEMQPGPFGDIDSVTCPLD